MCFAGRSIDEERHALTVLRVRPASTVGRRVGLADASTARRDRRDRHADVVDDVVRPQRRRARVAEQTHGDARVEHVVAHVIARPSLADPSEQLAEERHRTVGVVDAQVHEPERAVCARRIISGVVGRALRGEVVEQRHVELLSESALERDRELRPRTA